MDIFRDPVWQFWGVVIGVITIIITLVIYLLQRNRKILIYQVLTETSLLSVDDEIKEKIQIKFKQKNIQNLYLVIIKIENAGNLDISSVDFEEPISMIFPGSEILSVEIYDSAPKNLKPILSREKSKLMINPMLLNKKDFIIFKFIFSRYEQKINLESRIIGVKEIERTLTGKNNRISTANILLLLFYVFGSTISFTIVMLFYITNPETRIIEDLLALIVVSFAALLGYIFTFMLFALLVKEKSKA